MGARRLLVVGLGNEFRGDDGLGLYVARSLRRLLKGLGNVRVIVAEGGLENVTHAILRYRPTHMVLVDAAYVEGGEPGAVYIFSVDELSNTRSLSTHYIPPRVIIDYIRSYVDVDVLIIGVQVKEVGLGLGLSSEVLETCNYLVEVLNAVVTDVITRPK